MKLIHFFRLIQMSIFQRAVTNMMYNRGYDNKMTYDNTWFFCPRVVCNDGFSISLQIHNGNYCSSENGYRTLGHTIETVEFGYPNQDEELLKEYAECPESLTQTVGRLPIDVAQQIIDKHGGINWDKTVSVEEFNDLVYGKKDRK